MYLRVNLLGPGPSSYKKIIYRAAVSQRLGNTVIERLSIGWITGIHSLARAGLSLSSIGLHDQSIHVSCVYQFTSCR
jgi:hypothetical protein